MVYFMIESNRIDNVDWLLFLFLLLMLLNTRGSFELQTHA